MGSVNKHLSSILTNLWTLNTIKMFDKVCLSLLMLSIIVASSPENTKKVKMSKKVKKLVRVIGGNITSEANRRSYEAPSYSSSTYDYQSPTPVQDTRSLDLLGFLDGASLTSHVSLHFPIPLCQLTDMCSTLDIDLPFTLFQYSFNSGLGREGRSMEEEQVGLYQWAEGIFNRSGLPGRPCLLRSVCEMAQSSELSNYGLVGRALQAIFMIDTTRDITDNLVDYLHARVVGEEQGDCAVVYPDCPISLTHLDSLVAAVGPEILTNII